MAVTGGRNKDSSFLHVHMYLHKNAGLDNSRTPSCLMDWERNWENAPTGTGRMCKLHTEEGPSVVMMFVLCLHVLYVRICDGIQQGAVIHLMNIHRCDVTGVAQLAAPQPGWMIGLGKLLRDWLPCRFLPLSFTYVLVCH